VCGRKRVARLVRAAGLADVSLHPDHQRRGTGSALVRAAAVEAARAGCTWTSGRT
jgi:predicted N-acetyltransferase YhbS